MINIKVLTLFSQASWQWSTDQTLRTTALLTWNSNLLLASDLHYTSQGELHSKTAFGLGVCREWIDTLTLFKATSSQTEVLPLESKQEDILLFCCACLLNILKPALMNYKTEDPTDECMYVNNTRRMQKLILLSHSPIPCTWHWIQSC